jgi:L-arabinose isomerase
MNKPRIGLYSVGLRQYWSQFPNLLPRLKGYNAFIEKKLGGFGAVSNYGMVDSPDSSREAGEYFNRENVDIIFMHSATYFTSSCVLPAHQICKAPVITLNLQPAPRVDYSNIDTGEWLSQCVGCPAPEVSNAFERAGITFRCVNGLLGLDETPKHALSDEKTSGFPSASRAWNEIGEWSKAAGVKHALGKSVFGFLGGNYTGMLDMYSDFTMLSAQTGIHIEILEMCDLNRSFEKVTPGDIEAKLSEIHEMFEIKGGSPSDPMVKAPTSEELQWSARVAAAQAIMAREYRLNALAYYYHSAEGNPYEALQGGFIVGHSLLTAKGIPCAGEADIKTALAMKICDILSIGGSFCEIVVIDYIDGTVLIGHDGPFHIGISQGKPLLRGMGIYHGKKGSGISVEAKVKPGPVTTLNVTQSGDGKLKLIISEGEATAGPIMAIGNTQTPVKFSCGPDTYMEKWFAEAPTHHCALAVGHNAGLLKKVGELLDIHTVVL